MHNIKTPALILHGVGDAHVSVIQSMQLYNALKRKNLPTHIVYYIWQRHGIDDPIATLDAINEKLKWFKAHRK